MTEETLRDRYDQAIDYLVTNPQNLKRDWYAGADPFSGSRLPAATGASLFQMCARRTREDITGSLHGACCVHCVLVLADRDKTDEDQPRIDHPDPEVVLAVRRELQADPRLWHDGINSFCEAFEVMDADERREALQPFAEWQRRLDRELPWSDTYRELVKESDV